MSYLGTKPQIATEIADGIVTPADLSTGKPYWDASGNVGIGTSTLTGGNTILDLKKIGTGYGCNIRFQNSYNTSTYVGLAGDTTGDVIYYNGVASNNLFYTNGTERMRIDSSGRVTMPYQPAFYAMMNNTNITSTAAIIFEDVYVNIGSHYNPSNGRFTAPIAGTYHFSANFLKRNGAGRLLFHKNNSYYGSGVSQVYQGTTSEIPMAASIIITLAAGDYINVIANIDAGDVYGNANSHNGFSGFLIG